MPPLPRLAPLLSLSALILAAGTTVAAPPVERVEYNRDVRPILADHCFACHGPDKNTRKAGLRLDNATDATAERQGSRAVVPGKPEASEILKRLTTEEPSERMPPAKFGKPVSDKQVAILRRWIEQGGEYQEHWSRLAVKRPPLPNVKDAAWGCTPIDRFVLARLEKEGLRPSPEADRRTLLRRLSFDLTGLPPTPEEVDAFVNDRSADAYERVIDRLLASPHYGERMTLFWLDLVRYADTIGYHSDNHQDIALYRDYVLDAFNSNKRFDVFTREQLAGDLLPGATLQQKIASGYNRLNMVTQEGGAQAKEYMAKYSGDRVRNASVVWLGATLGCTECHDHKFDSFAQKDFYRFAAFFADIQEVAVGNQPPFRVPAPAQEAELKTQDERLAGLRQQLNTATPELESAQVAWEEQVRKDNFKGLPADVTAALKEEAGKRTEAQKQKVAAHYRGVAPLLEGVRKEVKATETRRAQVEATVPKTLISTAGPPRTIRVLARGNWQDDSGEIVEPGTPAGLPALGVMGRRATRLDLADWLMRRDNPVVARVFVNRLWSLCYGRGLVTTLDDLGAQGSWPSHPELLDWLADEFAASGWDVKHLVRLMVLSSTYRQSSHVDDSLRQLDPYNVLLARQARFRLDAELVRDNALAVSGLLADKVGGPSVKPYQPAGYWAYLNFPRREWDNGKGEDLYRRGLYTYWCRTFPHPGLRAFDAPTREECSVERPRSNTPQQALVLLNDPAFVEAARALAEQVLRAGPDDEARARFAFRRVLGRPATADELKVLLPLVVRHREQYRGDKQAALDLLHTGARPVPADLDVTELAAWTSACRVILNLHETITRN
jgi:mono/diheme cytochrome c family protein